MALTTLRTNSTRAWCVLLLGTLAAVNALAQPTYPAAYTAQKLPVLAGATITSTGRQSTSMKDGIRIELDTAAPVQEVLGFYRKEAAGWTETQSRAKVQLATIGRAEFTKGALTFEVSATRVGAVTKVTLNLLEK